MSEEFITAPAACSLAALSLIKTPEHTQYIHLAHITDTTLLLPCSPIYAAARSLQKFQIIEDPTSPIFTYSAAGNGKKWAYASEKAIFDAENKDKKSKDTASELVKLDANAFVVGKFPIAVAEVDNFEAIAEVDDNVVEVVDEDEDSEDGVPVIVSEATAAGIDAFGKAKLSHADAKVSTFNAVTQKWEPEGTVVQTATGLATADQTEIKGDSAALATVVNRVDDDGLLAVATETDVGQPNKFIEKDPNAKTFEDAKTEVKLIGPDGEVTELE